MLYIYNGVENNFYISTDSLNRLLENNLCPIHKTKEKPILIYVETYLNIFKSSKVSIERNGVL